MAEDGGTHRRGPRLGRAQQRTSDKVLTSRLEPTGPDQYIPVQLREWRFILVKQRDKAAFEKAWQTTANYAYDDPKLLAHLEKGGNYGVMAGNHVIIETDTSELETLVERELPATFTQRSPGHYSKHFFYNGVSKTIPLFDRSKPKGKDNVGHVKSGSSYVVGPGSTHPNGGLYEIVDSRPVASVSDEDVRWVLAVFIARRGLMAEKLEARKHHAPESFCILDLVSGIGLKEHGGQLQGPHPVHGSETGMNFSVNPKENVWHCFRCNSGGGPYQLLAVMEGVIDCEYAVPGGLRGEFFKRTRDLALEKGLIKKQTPTFTVDEEKPQLTLDAEPSQVAEAILGILHVRTIFKGETYVYDEGVYRPGGEAVIRRLVEVNFHKAGADETADNGFLNEVLGHVQRRTYTELEIFDSEPHILNLENGLFNLQTYQLGPHRPDYPSLSKLPVKYDPSTSCHRWGRFINEVVDPGDVQAVQEFIGSLLWKGYETQKAWLQVGEGANGKDALDRVLIALLGPENVSNHSLQALEENRFATASLHGKLANIYSDLRDTALKSTGTFKTLTGEGSLSAERKFQNAFSFQNHAKLVFSCNKIPLSPDDTDAFFRRWLITTFPNRFLGDRADPGIVAKLTNPEELSGILNWALEGLKRLRAQNWQLSNAKSIEDTREEYIRKSDQVKAFLMECCLPDPEGAVSKQQLYQAFILYCKGTSLPAVTSDTFFKRLPMAGIPVTPAKLGPKGKQVHSFKGLWLRKPDNWGRDPDEVETPQRDQETLPLTWTLGRKRVDRVDTLDTGSTAEASVSSVSRVSRPTLSKVQLEPHPGNILVDKDLCDKCWRQKYQSMKAGQKTGSPKSGSCEDCGEPASFRLRMEL